MLNIHCTLRYTDITLRNTSGFMSPSLPTNQKAPLNAEVLKKNIVNGWLICQYFQLPSILLEVKDERKIKWMKWPHVVIKIKQTYNPATFLCLSQARSWISNVICYSPFCVQRVQIRREMNICAVDTGGINDHQCSNFLVFS